MNRGIRLSAMGACILFCCGQASFVPIEETRFMMDTVVRISVYESDKSAEDVHALIDRTFEEMAEIERKTSRYADSSDVSRLAYAAGKSRVPVSSETFGLLNTANRISEVSAGAFDVTIGALKIEWGFDSEVPGKPADEDIETVLSRVDFRLVGLKDDGVLLAQTGMSIDLGGLAKGFIIDRAVEILQEQGIRAGIVDAGGDLRTFGFPPGRKKWRIGIRHPRSNEGALFGILEIGEASVATSGDYERYFIEDGRRYHHILNPKTGYPAGGCVSVTVVAENAVEADAYATAVFVLGPEQGMEFLDRLPSVQGMILYEDNGTLVHVMSAGLEEKIRLE